MVGAVSLPKLRRRPARVKPVRVKAVPAPKPVRVKAVPEPKAEKAKAAKKRRSLPKPHFAFFKRSRPSTDAAKAKPAILVEAPKAHTLFRRKKVNTPKGAAVAAVAEPLTVQAKSKRKAAAPKKVRAPKPKAVPKPSPVPPAAAVAAATVATDILPTVSEPIPAVASLISDVASPALASAAEVAVIADVAGPTLMPEAVPVPEGLVVTPAVVENVPVEVPAEAAMVVAEVESKKKGGRRLFRKKMVEPTPEEVAAMQQRLESWTKRRHIGAQQETPGES